MVTLCQACLMRICCLSLSIDQCPSLRKAMPHLYMPSDECITNRSQGCKHNEPSDIDGISTREVCECDGLLGLSGRASTGFGRKCSVREISRYDFQYSHFVLKSATPKRPNACMLKQVRSPLRFQDGVVK